jgi:flagellar basal body rod protein FlgG
LPGEALSIALTGIASATKRVEVASHNIANLQTKDFRPLRVRQSSRAAGGAIAEVERAPQPEPVSVAGELIGAELAGVQAKASARVVGIGLEVLGSLLDIFV